MELKNWADKNFLDLQKIGDNCFFIENQKFLVIESKELDGEKKLFDEDFQLILSKEDYHNIEFYNPDYFLFSFGSKWYYSGVDNDVELNIFKYVGKSKQGQKIDHAFLGLHGGYELCNGSRLYEDWVKKAKFLGIDKLGICEKNTLAGVLKFQEACLSEGIKPIIGETVVVKGDKLHEVKLYVIDKVGWKNLLNINSQINVFKGGYVHEDYLLEKNEGLICVIGDNGLTDNYGKIFKDENLYFQVDLVQYSSSEKDEEHLLNIQGYLQYNKVVQPILICDAYYLDKDEHEIKLLLNKIGKVKSFQSGDQHFKSTGEIVDQAIKLNLDLDILRQSFDNTNNVAKRCIFNVPTDKHHLPKYEMTKAEKFEDNDDLFLHLIEEGVKVKVKENEEAYWNRVEEEFKVIKEGNIVDYFLILADIINWCKSNDVLVGVGRGSAAGSLCAYLLGITEIDPIKYDLIFERFLNKARIEKGEMVDIDSDFESARRDDVKAYVELRYGKAYFASIGTYGNFKIKSMIKDLGREVGLKFSETNYISSLIKSEDSLTEFFKESVKDERLKKFINKNWKLVETMSLIANQPKNKSIHACATVIIPSKNSIYDTIPVQSIDGVLVSEWEGKQVEKAGFLKEDILGILQLDKFRNILNLVKKDYGEVIDWTKLNVNNEEVYELFKKGYTEDVFQFTTESLKKYCKLLKPDSIEELIAANALHRPGAMISNAHYDYVKVKLGEKKVKHDLLLEKVTEKTFGLFIYQEQVMRAFQVITDSTLEEADMFRKIITKSGFQDEENFKKLKKIFCDSYVMKGSDVEDAEKVWEKLIVFSKYAFNRSHSACYAYTAYVCNWFKRYYPLQFWVTSLKFSREDSLEKKILEIEETGDIKLHSPDINVSGKDYVYDLKGKAIYWALNSVKFSGDKSVDAVIEERGKNGDFKSLEDFVKRVKVNKRVLTNFILCGCFDKVENIENLTDRNLLLGEKVVDAEADKEYFWLMRQKELCGIGSVRFDKLCEKEKKINKLLKSYKYLDFDSIDDNVGKNCMIVGVVNNIREFKTKNGDAGKLELSENGKTCYVTCWNDFWDEHKNELNKDDIIMLSGVVREFRGANSVHVNGNSIFKVI